MISAIRRFIDARLGSGEHSATVPPLDGVLGPNQAIEEAPVLVEAPEPDNLAGDGERVRFSTGDTVMRLAETPGSSRLRAEAPRSTAPAAAHGPDALRLAAIGETIATLSHSIKNIMQGLRGGADAVELALQRGDLDRAREGWPVLARNLDRPITSGGF